MPQIIAWLLAALQLLTPFFNADQTIRRLRSGEYLRLHVVAQDDTDEMQRIKLCVRDAVQACFLELHDCSLPTMQAQAEGILPQLTEAARTRAAAEGFSGDVTVTLGTFAFGDRELEGITVPAGEYPALMILMGDAQGQNWWGLLDPETSLHFAASDTGDEVVRWDWSLRGLLRALFSFGRTASDA